MIGFLVAAAISAADYKATTSIAVLPVPPQAFTAAPYTIVASASHGGPITYESRTPTVCAAPQGVVIPKLAGLCVLIAKTAATPTHVAGRTPFEFAITAVLAPPPIIPWTPQQAFFAACGPCPSTKKIETQSCAAYTIIAIDGGACIDSAKCKWSQISSQAMLK